MIKRIINEKRIWENENEQNNKKEGKLWRKKKNREKYRIENNRDLEKKKKKLK